MSSATEGCRTEGEEEGEGGVEDRLLPKLHRTVQEVAGEEVAEEVAVEEVAEEVAVGVETALAVVMDRAREVLSRKVAPQVYTGPGAVRAAALRALQLLWCLNAPLRKGVSCLPA